MKYQILFIVIVSQISEFVNAANQNEYTSKRNANSQVKSDNFAFNNPESTRKIVNLENSGEEFLIKKPVVKNAPDYNQFLSFLYRNDIQKQTIPKSRNVRDISTYNREKRALIFRPLFVYKQQEIKRQKVKEAKQKGSKVTTRPGSKVQSKNG